MIEKDISSTLEALANETRLRIVKMVRKKRGMYCQEILKATDLSQPAIAHHLHKLVRAKVLAEKREKNQVFYTVRRDTLRKVFRKVMED